MQRPYFIAIIIKNKTGTKNLPGFNLT